MKAWWESWPHLFEAEMAAFASHGATVQIVNQDRGLLTLDVSWPRTGTQPIHLKVDVSPLHPFFRPVVAAPDDELPRHQHPIDKHLCLLTQDSGQWDSNQLIADFLAERLDQLFKALVARAEGKIEEASQFEEIGPDPISGYYLPDPENNSVVLFDGTMPLPQHQVGLAKFIFWQRPFFDGSGTVESIFRSVETWNGKPIRNFHLPFDLPGATEAPGRWVRMKPPHTLDPKALLAAAESEIAKMTLLQPAIAKALGRVSEQPSYFTALIFEEEVAYGEKGVGCVFLFTRRDFGNKAAAPNTFLLRAERAGEADMFSRLPFARTLRSKKVLLVGCGAIGSFAALELARAGIGNLYLMDRDHVQPGNSLRWPMGRTMWGIQKVIALKDFILCNYPWTKVESLPYSIGTLGMAPADLGELLRKVDLVVDASASSEVQQALAFHVPRAGKPYVMGNATLGLAGGIVVRLRAGEETCFACLQNHLNDGSIAIRSDDDGIVIPVGCNASTFTGGAFDLQEITLELVRSTIGLLSDEYDLGSWTVSIVELRDENGKRILPRWHTHEVTAHPRCCGAGK